MSSTLPDLRTRGRWPLPDLPKLAIVGARRPTPYGEAVAESLAGYLARSGVLVVSRLTLGFDAASHEGALLLGGALVAFVVVNVTAVRRFRHRHNGMAG